VVNNFRITGSPIRRCGALTTTFRTVLKMHVLNALRLVGEDTNKGVTIKNTLSFRTTLWAGSAVKQSLRRCMADMLKEIASPHVPPALP
jgi:succinate dehydrogenase/fumarate reductase cytochrome b subunit